MKKAILKTLAGALMITGLFSTTLTSCSDPCKDIVCENAGTCDEGVCTCLDGFSGTNCEIEDLCITQDVTCNNGGTCLDGTCTCTTGYEGTDCSTLVRAKYLGNFNGASNCSLSGAESYGLSITAGSSDLDVSFDNLYNVGFFTTGTVAADGSINIPSQAFGTGTVSGNATISGTTVTVVYTISGGGVSDNCTAVFTK